MEKTIEVSKDLWLVVEDVPMAYDGLFHLVDSVEGDVLIDIAEIPQLIEALQTVQRGVIQ